MPVVTFCNRGIWEDFNATHFTSEDNLRYILLSSVELWYLPYIKWILWWLLLVNGITNPWCTFWIGQHQYWSITMFSYLLPYNHNNAKKIILGFLVYTEFWQILMFFSLCIKVTWVLLLFLKVHILIYPKQFLLFPKFFHMSWDSKARYGKIGFGPFCRPY